MTEMLVRVGERLIGAGHPCLIAAEIGINHNGDMALAEQSIDAAADAGADAVKFQNYQTENFLHDNNLTYSYFSEGRKVTESQYAMFKRCELPTGALNKLKAHCDRRGLIFFSTPTSVMGVTELAATGAHLVKNGSDFLTNPGIVKQMAMSGLTTILSTGMANLAEIDDAVRRYRSNGGKDLVLLHCTSSYPTPSDQINLRRIKTLHKSFGCPVGFSDHSEGVVAAVAAVVLGACIIEKHFTLSRALPGPDHSFSSDPAEFSLLVKSIRTAEAAMGDSQPGPTEAEQVGRTQFRLSCTASRALTKGLRLMEQDICMRRPGNGIEPRMMDSLVGLTLCQDLMAGQTLTWEHFKNVN